MQRQTQPQSRLQTILCSTGRKTTVLEKSIDQGSKKEICEVRKIITIDIDQYEDKYYGDYTRIGQIIIKYKELKHPNILPFTYVGVNNEKMDNKQLYTITTRTQYIQHQQGTNRKYNQNRYRNIILKQKDFKLLMKRMTELSAGLMALHHKGIYHRNIKFQNIFEVNKQMCLADISFQLSNITTSPRQDIHDLGVVFIQLAGKQRIMSSGGGITNEGTTTGVTTGVTVTYLLKCIQEIPTDKMYRDEWEVVKKLLTGMIVSIERVDDVVMMLNELNIQIKEKEVCKVVNIGGNIIKFGKNPFKRYVTITTSQGKEEVVRYIHQSDIPARYYIIQSNRNNAELMERLSENLRTGNFSKLKMGLGLGLGVQMQTQMSSSSSLSSKVMDAFFSDIMQQIDDNCEFEDGFIKYISKHQDESNSKEAYIYVYPIQTRDVHGETGVIRYMKI